jgi:peptidoglycan hydrolase CwlO-like protein
MNLKKLVILSLMSLSLSIALGSTAKSENCETRIKTCKAILEKAVTNLEAQQATIEGLADAAEQRERVIQEQDKQLTEANKDKKKAQAMTITTIGLLLLKVLIL